jgi:flagellar hook-associated protein 2
MYTLSLHDALPIFLIQSLTSVEEDKTTYDPEYAENQYEMQIGSVLTGNYGVQLLSSQLKSIIASQGLGFTYYSNKNGVETGDIFSTLSQIGIMTDSNEGSTTYGQLLINTTNSDGSTTFGNGAMTLSEALEKDPQGVAQLFAASSTGVSDSPYFSHNSHVQGITSPGTYDVSYSTDASGNIVSAYINGKEAEIDPDTRQISIYSHFGKPNAADGIVLDVYDLSPGQTFTGSVSVKQGKINEILGKLDGTDGWLGEDGPLRVLEKNYQTVIQNIEEKIMKEDARLEKWERNMRTRFANLEATLTKYNQINEDLKSQIASLNNNSSS